MSIVKHSRSICTASALFLRTRIDRWSYGRHRCHAPDGASHGVVARFSGRARENSHKFGACSRVFYTVLVMEFILVQRAELTDGEVSRKVV